MTNKDYQTRLREYDNYLGSEVERLRGAKRSLLTECAGEPTPSTAITSESLQERISLLTRTQEKLYSFFPELKNKSKRD